MTPNERAMLHQSIDALERIKGYASDLPAGGTVIMLLCDRALPPLRQALAAPKQTLYDLENMAAQTLKEVLILGKQANQWKKECQILQLALETENLAATLFARQLAHWIGKHDEAMAEIERLRSFARDVMNWIPTVDRLPEAETPVLIVRNGVMRIGERVWEDRDEVTHWMPLPALPFNAEDKPPQVGLDRPVIQHCGEG